VDDLTRRTVLDIYHELLKSSNSVLHKCTRFKIELLQLENPSISEIAEQLLEAASIIWTISDDFPDDAEGYHVASKANEYAQQVKLIAKAIKREDQTELDRLVQELKRRPFL